MNAATNASLPAPPAPGSKRPRRSRWAMLRDAASLYLPILIIGILALGTFWLVSNTPESADKSPRTAEERSEPDYQMQDFAMRTYRDDGHLKTEIRGEKGRHYPDTDRLEVDGVNIRGYDDANQLTTATARQAVSLQGGEEAELRGNAVVVREAGPDPKGQMQPRMEFHGDELKVFPNDNKVSSNQPVLIVRGQDRITADRLDYDHNSRIVDLQGRVRSVLQPRGTAGNQQPGSN